MLDLYNPGVGGVGKVRVFQVTQIATTPQDGTYNAVASLRLTVSNANKTFRYANDVVYGPGDFTPGTPTVLDRSDPYALSNAYLAWLKNGAGSLRRIDSLFGYGGQAPTSEARARLAAVGLLVGVLERAAQYDQRRLLHDRPPVGSGRHALLLPRRLFGVPIQRPRWRVPSTPRPPS